jgi:hypothetical protein
MIFLMVDDPHKPDKPDPVDDLKRGLGLLFRAAKTVVDKLPSDRFEEMVVTGVREVGRAIENVTDQIDRQVFGGKGTIPRPPPNPPSDETGKEHPKAPGVANDVTSDGAEARRDAPPDQRRDAPRDGDAPDDEPPRGPRVG